MIASSNTHTAVNGCANLFALARYACNSLIIRQLPPPPVLGKIIPKNCIKNSFADEFLFGRLLSCAKIITL